MCRNNGWIKLAAAGLVATVMAAAAVGTARADGPATAPAAATPTTQAGTRPIAAVMQDFQATGQELSTVVKPAEWGDAAKRDAVKDKALPMLHRMDELLDEMAGSPQGTQVAAAVRPQILAIMMIYGDNAAQAAVEKRAGGSGDDAVDAKGELLFARWVRAGGDGAQQAKVADETIALAKQNPTSETLTQFMLGMTSVGNGSAETDKKLKDSISNDLTSPTAQSLKTQMQADEKLGAMENKPLVLAGPTKDGTAFTTADWKGKVILVDFWATWCGPCREELPRVTKAYKDYHAQGLEVLGVSCDNDLSSLNTFLQQNPDMAWPQLFDASKPGWHPLATSYGINAIPTMFLIDRKGVLRSVTARENLEDMIPKLLAESAK